MKYLLIKCENLGGDVYFGLFNFFYYDLESIESGDENCLLDEFGFLVLEFCKKEKEVVKLSFFGWYCKLNGIYFCEYYMDLSKLLNLNNKFRLRRSIFKIKLDRYIKIIEEKILLFSVVVKKELGIVNRVENYGLLLVKKEFKVIYVGDLNVFVIVLCKND